ncbi:acyl-CoA N-acyltransferase [Paraphysoderma sedebokerense]|nr:acyl-CoA N-acyltransferase [Paraphysoderma sedebokerense]
MTRLAVLPTFEVGQIVDVRRIVNNEISRAKIIEKRISSGTKDEFEYYVHYENCDKRLDEWIVADRIIQSASMASTTDFDNKFGRRQKTSAVEETPPILKDDSPVPQILPSTTHTEQSTPEDEVTPRNIEVIEFGTYEIPTWYYSPYPEEVRNEKKLYICEFCLKYMKSPDTYARHKISCKEKSPPGTKIYHCGEHKIFEIDGKVSKLYCQNICLLAKLFLDHKTIYYDVETFMFYVLTESDQFLPDVDHFVGFFSKEKFSLDNFNLACIMTLPCFQKKGYGRMMIEFSYELSKLEKKIGHPERPLSDLGLLSYKSYWASVLVSYFQTHEGGYTIADISQETSIRPEDIVSTLHAMGFLKFWKDDCMICVTTGLVNEFIDKHPKLKTEKLIDSSCINWSVKVDD